MRKTNTKITIFLLFLGLIGQSSVFLAYASEINSENVIRLVNEERSKNNLPDLALNVKLSKIAENKAKDMIEKDYFAHTSPEGKNPWHWFEKEGYKYAYAGENLAINFTTAEKQNESWMKSPTHRKNILSENFKEIGVAVVKGMINEKEVTVTVQEFGTRTQAGSVAGESVVSEKEDLNVSEEKEVLKIDPKEERFFAGIISKTKAFGYLKIMKGFAIASAFTFIVFIFTYFAYRISKIGDILGRIEKRFFRSISQWSDFHSRGHKIVVRFFPMDMMKIRVTHLHHMKQRE